ncbi:hypothetical protein ACFL6O_02650 [candidate division KSB1 bacterium]
MDYKFSKSDHQHIVSRQSIVVVDNYFNGPLLDTTNPTFSDRVFISKARTGVFKKWLER